MITASDIVKAKEKVFSIIDKHYFPGQKIVCSYSVLNKTKFFGYNSQKSHPSNIQIGRNGFHYSCKHAEVSSIMQVPRQSRHKLRIYVFRFLKNGTLSMAKPCKSCQKFLKEEGINLKNIWYSDWNGNWQRMTL